MTDRHGDRCAKRRLVIFARLPLAGHAKTRLAPRLGSAGAAELYQAFLDDTVRVARQIEGAEPELWVVNQPRAAQTLGSRYPGIPVRPQPCGDLGDRLEGVFDSRFEVGCDRAMIIGSDHPTLPADYLRRGFDALDDADLVLGPTLDGGYYAIGLRRAAWPRARALFRGVPWSTPGVLAATRLRADRLELRRLEIPEWYDVDEPAQLDRLARDADPSSATGLALAGLRAGGGVS
jgi:rSAM/selenodomain-associated transferase 1